MVVGSLLFSALLTGFGLWLGWGGNEVYRTQSTPVIAASTSEYATTQQDADEQCTRTPGCVGFATFFPKHQEAVIAQWLAMYTHLETFLREYEQLSCTNHETVCLQAVQEKLFVVSGYQASDGWEGFRESRDHRKQTTQPYASPLSAQSVRNLHAPFDRLGQTATWIMSPSFVTSRTYTQDIVYLLRGLQYQIKYTLLELDQTGTFVPRSTRQ